VQERLKERTLRERIRVPLTIFFFFIFMFTLTIKNTLTKNLKQQSKKNHIPFNRAQTHGKKRKGRGLSVDGSHVGSDDLSQTSYQYQVYAALLRNERQSDGVGCSLNRGKI
jgi:hypothetical protein